MKDIQEILMEMDKLSEQIATTLDEGIMELPILEPPVILENVEKTGCAECGDGVVSQQQSTCTCSSACPPCNDRVQYCCKVPVPIGFNVLSALTGTGGPRGTRSLAVKSCLYCFVDPIPCQVTITTDACSPITANIYPIRVIGCIQYIASLTNVQGTCGINSTANIALTQLRNDQNTAAVSCQSSICVNQVVGHQGTAPTQAQSTPKAIPCNALSGSLTVRLEDCDCGAANLDKTQVLTFRGEFQLPRTCS